MSPSPLPPDVDWPFACVALAWQAHEGELRGFLRHRLPDGHAAEDLLQDVFGKAMRQGQGFCRQDNPRDWRVQVARHAGLLRVRQRMRDRLITVCRVNVDPDDGRVCGHDGRIDSAAQLCP